MNWEVEYVSSNYLNSNAHMPCVHNLTEDRQCPHPPGSGSQQLQSTHSHTANLIYTKSKVGKNKLQYIHILFHKFVNILR